MEVNSTLRCDALIDEFFEKVNKDFSILLVSPMPPLIGGISISVDRLYKRLKADGYEVDVFSLSFKNDLLNSRWMRMLKFCLLPFFLLFHRKYDIIHCHTTGSFRWYYATMCKRLFSKKSKLVFTLHGDAKSAIKSSKLKRLGKYTDLLICVQPGDASRVTETFGIAAVDIPAFIYPDKDSIDTSLIPPEIDSFVEKAEAPVMIVTGSVVLWPQMYDLYGFSDALSNYLRLRDAGINCRLLMILTGKMGGHQKEYVNSLISQVDGDENVKIVLDSHFPLLPLLPKSKIFLRPTKTDGDALSVREALASNCCVIASDVSVRPEGTLVYHTLDDLFILSKKVLTGQEKISSFLSLDFYDDIVSSYQNLMTK